MTDHERFENWFAIELEKGSLYLADKEDCFWLWQAATKAERERWAKRVLEPVKFALTSEIESLRAQLAECQKDAARLDSKSIVIKIRNEFGDDEECMYVDFDLRKAIDQAMSEKG